MFVQVHISTTVQYDDNNHNFPWQWPFKTKNLGSVLDIYNGTAELSRTNQRERDRTLLMLLTVVHSVSN